MGECLVAAAILHASAGRLSPCKPIADDDGMDLLLLDKVTRRAVPLQIKCRRNFDDPRAQTVQFDVRLKTFTQEGEGYLLCVKLEGVAIETVWLIPAAALRGVARPGGTHLTVVPSAKPTSLDRLTPYRMTSFDEVVARILGPKTP